MKTSIHYQLSNVIFPEKVLKHFSELKDTVLIEGPKNVMDYLAFMWERVSSELERIGLEATDKDKEITPMSFRAYLYSKQDGLNLYGIEFPDYDGVEPACKYAIIADYGLDIPKYYTLEYSQCTVNGKPRFAVGEISLVNGELHHINYGTIDELKDIWEFFELVREKIEK